MAKRLNISGQVQGVGFRYAMCDEAARLGVAGWVRNRRNGTVEAVVEGPAAALEAIIAWARRGPPGARVSAVAIEEMDGEFSSFELHSTV